MDVTTSRETHFLLVRLLRDGQPLFENKLSGTVWIADVSLIPAGKIRGEPVTMRVIRGGLLFLFAFCVLAFGAVEVWSGSVLEIGASLLFIGWAAIVFLDRASDLLESSELALLGLFAIGLAQLLLHATPYPFLTRVELLKLAAYLMIFFLSTQAFRERRDLTTSHGF